MARTRHFFNGLTEEIKKESVAGAWASGAAGTTVYKSQGDSTAKWYTYDSSPGGAAYESVFDTTLWSWAVHFTGATVVPFSNWGNGFLLGEGARTWDQNPSDSAWNDTARSLVGWKFRTTQAAVFYVIVACNDGQERYLMYLTGEGTDSKDCRYLRFYLGANLTDNTWKSVERDVRADLARFEPGLAWGSAGVPAWPSSGLPCGQATSGWTI